jgi:DNA-binding transcriptional LysR family regulator
LSQPTISVQLRTLEEDLGFVLFVREHKKLHLSANGKLVLIKAESIFHLADQLGMGLAGMGAHPKPEFHVGVLNTISSSFTFDFANHIWFERSIIFSMSSGCKKTLSVGLDSGSFDLILSDKSWNQNTRYTSILLDSDKLIAVAAQAENGTDLHFPKSLHGMNYIAHRGDIGSLVSLGDIDGVKFQLWAIFPTHSGFRDLVENLISGSLIGSISASKPPILIE